MACTSWKSTFLFQTSDFDQAKLYFIKKGKMTTMKAMAYIASTVASRYPGNAGWTLNYVQDLSYVLNGKQVCQKGYAVLVSV